VRNTVDAVYISPDEQLVTLKSKKGADILDTTTGRSLFTYPVVHFLSIGFSLDLAFVAFLLPHKTEQAWNAHIHHYRTVQTWNAHTRCHHSITVDDDVFHIALSPDGSQLASLSPSHMKLWDLKSERCLACWDFGDPLEVQVQISFSTDATCVSVLNNSGTQSWRIHTSRKFARGSRTKKSDTTKLPMIFVPTTEERSNQDASALCRSYHCNTDDEWILDQDGRRVLWIPPDERPRKVWNTIKCEKVMVIQTESRKVYRVNFSQS
jgi:hypothetical protein